MGRSNGPLSQSEADKAMAAIPRLDHSKYPEWISSLVIVSLALGTAAVEGSVTTPLSSAVVFDCAQTRELRCPDKSWLL